MLIKLFRESFSSQLDQICLFIRCFP